MQRDGDDRTRRDDACERPERERQRRSARAREGAADTEATVVRLHPLRVLVVSADQSFRTVTVMLIARRGCSALSLDAAAQVGGLLAHERIDVVVVDGLALLRDVARELACAVTPTAPVGVVLAAERDEPIPPELVAVTKWSPFEHVFAAIAQADRRRARPRAFGCPPGLTLLAADTRG